MSKSEELQEAVCHRWHQQLHVTFRDSENRFTILISCLRSDNQTDKADHKETSPTGFI